MTLEGMVLKEKAAAESRVSELETFYRVVYNSL